MREWSKSTEGFGGDVLPLRSRNRQDTLEPRVTIMDSGVSSPTNSSFNAHSGVAAGKHAKRVNTSRYKTELCRAFEEKGSCKYGAKCQFAHGITELRQLPRHPKYKTEMCRTFHNTGLCPYGPRCHFIHDVEQLPKELYNKSTASQQVSSDDAIYARQFMEKQKQARKSPGMRSRGHQHLGGSPPSHRLPTYSMETQTSSIGWLSSPHSGIDGTLFSVDQLCDTFQDQASLSPTHEQQPFSSSMLDQFGGLDADDNSYLQHASPSSYGGLHGHPHPHSHPRHDVSSSSSMLAQVGSPSVASGFDGMMMMSSAGMHSPAAGEQHASFLDHGSRHQRHGSTSSVLSDGLARSPSSSSMMLPHFPQQASFFPSTSPPSVGGSIGSHHGPAPGSPPRGQYHPSSSSSVAATTAPPSSRSPEPPRSPGASSPNGSSARSRLPIFANLATN